MGHLFSRLRVNPRQQELFRIPAPIRPMKPRLRAGSRRPPAARGGKSRRAFIFAIAREQRRVMLSFSVNRNEHQTSRRSTMNMMNPCQAPPAAVALLTAAVLVAVFVAGGLPAVFAYAVALEIWIRCLTPAHEQVPVRHDEDPKP
jgi:hypothetical protein